MGDLVRLAKEALKQRQANSQKCIGEISEGSERSQHPIPPTIQGPEQGKEIVIEPAHPFARLTYFEDGFGRICGPVIPEFLARVGEEFWIVTTFDAQPRWIRSDRLRSQQAFETQKPVIVSEPIREV